MRVISAFFLFTLLSLANLGSINFNIALASSNSSSAEGSATLTPWPMFHHDLRHTGFSPSSAPNTNDLLWTFQTGDSIASSPAVVNGKVFIGSMDRKMYALNQFSGTLIWSTTVDNYIFFGSPAVYAKKVFITVGSEILALDEATGAILWRYNLGSSAEFSSPMVANNMVFVGSAGGYPPMGKVFALDMDTGTLVWKYSDKTGVWSSPAVADGMVFVSSMKFSYWGKPGKVFALNQSSGKLIWATPIGDGAFLSSPSISGGRVFVGGGISSSGHVYALDKYTGSILWQRPTEDPVYSSPAVAYGKVFVGCYDGKIYAFNMVNGDIVWTFQTGDGVASSPAVAEGKVFVGSDDRNVYALNATTGAKIWNFTTGHWVYSSPAVADGAVFVGSLDGNVYAFGLPAITSFTVHPNPFSPNGDGRKDTTTLAASFNTLVKWKVQVRSSAGVLVRSWAGTGSALTIIWGGKDASGTIVPDGVYIVRLSGSDLSGTSFKTEWRQIRVDNTPPTANVTVDPLSFNPTLGQKTTITYKISEACYITIKIYSSTGGLVKTLLNNVLNSACSHSIVWNGKDDAGNIVSPGTYNIKIFVVDKAGNRASPYPVSRTVTVTA